MKLNTEQIGYIALFENETGANVKDCVIDGKDVVFVVGEGEAGVAVGRNGKNVRKIQGILNKRIVVVEYAPDPIRFIKNIFYPVNILNVSIVEREGRRIAYVRVDPKDRRTMEKLLRQRLKIAKNLAERHFKIKKVVVV